MTRKISDPLNEKLLNLSLKLLQDQITSNEILGLSKGIRDQLLKGNQKFFDFLSNEFAKKDPRFGEDWAGFMEVVSSTRRDLINSQGEQMKATLFFIPIVFGVETTAEGQNGDFEIVQLGKIREMMAKAGLISHSEENISTLTDLFLFDEIATLNETQKFDLLQLLLSGKGRNPLSRDKRIPPQMLRSGALDIKLRFIVGCALLKRSKSPSQLYHVLGFSEDIEDLSEDLDEDIDDDFDDAQFEKSAEALDQFTSELTQKLSKLLSQKDGAKPVLTDVHSILPWRQFGIIEAVRQYDRFKWNLLLAEADQTPSARIRMTQSDPEFVDLTLCEDRREIQNIRISSQFESPEEAFENLNDLFSDLDHYKFKTEVETDHMLIFSKEGKEEDRKSDQKNKAKKGHLSLVNRPELLH